MLSYFGRVEIGSSSAAGLNAWKMQRNPSIMTCHVARNGAITQMRSCWYHSMIETMNVKEIDEENHARYIKLQGVADCQG